MKKLTAVSLILMMFLSVLMLSRYNYLESNYIHYFQPVVGFLIGTLEER